MKVLFNTQPTAFQSSMFGGAEVQLLKTKEGLEKLGIKVKGFDPFNDKFEDFQIFQNFSMQRDSFKAFSVAKNSGLKLALSSIYWPPEELLFSDEKFKSLGKIIFERLALWKNEKNPFYQIYPYKGYLELADIVLPNSETEKKVLIKRFGISASKISIVPNGVDKKFLRSNPSEFIKKYKKKDFVLFVGRIDPRKNLLKLIRATKELDLELVVIGNVAPFHSDYPKKCLDAAKGSKTVFLGSFPPNSSILSSAYAAAKTLALPSWYETPGLVALEAGLAGCNLMITNRGSTKDYFEGFAEFCNPVNFDSIKEALNKAHSRPKSKNLSQHILKNYTWEMVAKKTLEAYKKVLK